MMPGLQLWPPPVRPSNEAPWIPTPEEITEACLEIQAEWSEADFCNRLRPDWRPGEWCLPRAETPEVPL